MGEDGIPWQLGVFDAHCHPTDTMASLQDIPNMKARALTVMATRAQDQGLVDEAALSLAARDMDEAITRSDADSKGKIVPSFGWHPWFSYQLFFESDFSGATSLSSQQRTQHYQKVLTPAPDQAYIDSLPEPQSIEKYLAQTKDYLQRYPLALVGEIGLDRGFRLPEAWKADDQSSRDDSLTPGGREGRRLSPYKVSIDHQKAVLIAQLNLAGELQRPVSVHGVQAPGILYDTISSTWKGYGRSKRERKQAKEQFRRPGLQSDGIADDEADGPKPFPPRICLHSYSGQVETIKQYLHPAVPADVYFSFSTLVNFGGESTKAEDSVRAVPDDRILIESDLHTAGQRMDDMLESIIRKTCELKGWGLEDGVRQLGANWKRYVFGREE